MKVRTLINITFFILLGLSSCQTKKAYIGPRQKNDSLATIKAYGYANNIGGHTVLDKVDSLFVNTAHNSYRFRKCVVLPGTHTIEFTINNTITFNGMIRRVLYIGTYLVTFEAEAGKTYTIDAETDLENSIVDVYVTEAMSGEIVPSIVEHKYKLKEKN